MQKPKPKIYLDITNDFLNRGYTVLQCIVMKASNFSSIYHDLLRPILYS